MLRRSLQVGIGRAIPWYMGACACPYWPCIGRIAGGKTEVMLSAHGGSKTEAMLSARGGGKADGMLLAHGGGKTEGMLLAHGGRQDRGYAFGARRAALPYEGIVSTMQVPCRISAIFTACALVY